MTPPEPNASVLELCRQIERTNALLAEQLALAKNWKVAMRNGLAAGLGGVIGATLLVSLTLGVLRPLQGLDRLGPILERIERDLDRR